MPQSGQTKERLLEAAERLFAREGLSKTSLRSITEEAGVNVAAIHYHFGSKDDLLAEILRQRVAPMNRERLAKLAEIESRIPEGPLPLEPVLRAFIEPAFRLRSEISGNEHVGRLFGRLYCEPDEVLESTMREVFETAALRFRAALERALPGLSPRELDLRQLFLTGTMVHVLLGRRAWHAPNLPSEADAAVINQLIAFSTAGLQAAAQGDS